MSDPFIDPLDMAPIRRQDTENPRAVASEEAKQRERITKNRDQFAKILLDKVKQQPTPLQIPKPMDQSLRPQEHPANSVVPKEKFPRVESDEPTLLEFNSRLESQSKPNENDDAVKSNTQIPTQGPTLPPTPSATPVQSEHRQSLRELLQAQLQKQIDPTLTETSTPEPTKTAVKIEPEEQPTAKPTEAKTIEPTAVPTSEPTAAPTAKPVEQPEAKTTESPSPVLDHDDPEPAEYEHLVKRGDTLSEIIASRLHETGVDYQTRDIYRLVNAVARQNGLDNPNRIYAGQQLDLSPLYEYEPVIVQKQNRQTAFLDGSQLPLDGKITSPFGMRLHPISNEMEFHKGIDISAATGTPVYAVKPGVVSFSGEQSGYGQIVEVDHGDGTQTRYAHLSERMVNEGDRIDATNPIAFSGNTGSTTGPHLHFEVRENGRPVDPVNYFPASSFGGGGIEIARGNTNQTGM